ncbi:caax prenyl protease 2-like [Stylonychia lemnae]|uniref:intramembrane prenyl-peptidase Rce1 n=1 Tax=Stylonychia lemnae TaxID=5949 RepID=A0A078BCS8_STYLE|nr:caax prenyl protease 2-like [Stylonychia lemnae]|eukprot:CDW91388.1 caax prenyl protease 2-like [Stylonychia lemnae]
MKLEVQPLEAVVLGFGFSSIFVLSLYFWKIFEGKKPQGYFYDENSQTEILKRVSSVVVFSFTCISFLNIKADHRQRDDVDLFRWFGLHFDGQISLAIANTLMLNSILFLGEIVQYLWGMNESDYFQIDLLTFKNLVLVPIFEELIFRACLINIFIEANIMSMHKCVLILPIFFAVAHLHHLYRQRHLPAEQFKRAALQKVFQIFYTQVFGIYAGYIYVYTGSLWAAIALHAQCNYFGFPSFGNLFDEEFPVLKRQIVGYLYLVGVVCFFNFFGFFMDPNYYNPWLLKHYYSLNPIIDPTVSG